MQLLKPDIDKYLVAFDIGEGSPTDFSDIANFLNDEYGAFQLSENTWLIATSLSLGTISRHIVEQFHRVYDRLLIAPLTSLYFSMNNEVIEWITPIQGPENEPHEP